MQQGRPYHTTEKQVRNERDTRIRFDTLVCRTVPVQRDDECRFLTRPGTCLRWVSSREKGLMILQLRVYITVSITTIAPTNSNTYHVFLLVYRVSRAESWTRETNTGRGRHRSLPPKRHDAAMTWRESCVTFKPPQPIWV